MAISRSDKFKAALFLLVTLGLFIIMVLALVGTSWMHEQNKYYIEFKESVRGLKPGSPVRYYGEEIGKVQRIKYESGARVAKVTIEVNPVIDIKVDSKATLEIDSLIIGNRFIEITPGTINSDSLPPNDPKHLIDSAPSNFQKFQANVQDLSAELPSVIDNINRVFSKENASSLSSILYQVDTFMSTNASEFTETMAEFRATLKIMNEALESANSMILQNQRAIAQTIQNLQKTTYTLNELLDKVNRQPAVLLHGTPHKENPWDETYEE